LIVEQSNRDVTARIARLLVYPIKSCAGIELEESILCDTGLEFDRTWMMVDQAGEFVTQREFPRMALIQPQLAPCQLELRTAGMPPLRITLDATGRALQARVWNDTVPAHDVGDTAAHWLTAFLGHKLRLVRFDPNGRRLSNVQWTGGVEAPNQFSDGYPLLVTSEASLDSLNDRLGTTGHAAVGMNRFRPNIVLSGIAAHDEDRLDELHIAAAGGAALIKPVKPCTRCPIPNIDPATAASSPEVTDTLQTYRQNAQMNGAVTFGVNAIVLQGMGQVLRVGQTVSADYRFD
jgi:uncharacterized protein